MIGREAYKNPWIFNSNFSYENIEGKKKVIFSYINFLKNNFKKYTFLIKMLYFIFKIFLMDMKELKIGGISSTIN